MGPANEGVVGDPLGRSSSRRPTITQVSCTVDTMSDEARPNETREGLIVAPLDEAIRSAKPWKWDEPSGLEDITDAEWDAFIAALESR